MSPADKLILVVDDESEILEQVAEVLAAANHTCHCCTTAEAAIASASLQYAGLPL